MATLTETLSNGLKSLFSGLGKKTTDSNYAVPLVNNSSAEPNGYMEMRNLANTLAKTIVGSGQRLPNSANLNNYKDAGVFTTGQASETNALSNCPLTGGAITLIVFNPYGIGNTTSGCFQMLFGFTGIYYRTYSMNTWAGWQKVTMGNV